MHETSDMYFQNLAKSKNWRYSFSGSKLPINGMVWVPAVILHSVINRKMCYWYTITWGNPNIEPPWGTYNSISNRKPTAQANNSVTYTNLVEVFVGNFVSATNNLSPLHLPHFLREMLHGVHSISPPLHITKQQGQDPISQKKLAQEEVILATTKEILGWFINGSNFTLQLMPDKYKK